MHKESREWYLNSANVYERWAFNENLFSEAECDAILNYVNKQQLNEAKIEGKATKSDLAKIRRSNVIFLNSSDTEIKWVFQTITDSIVGLNNQFFKFDLEKIETLQFTEYHESYNGFYGKHIDTLFESPVFRKLSFTIQLSDEKDYTGGDVLLHLSEEPNIFVKKRGSINVFPSYYLHEVTPVQSGCRYSLVGWVLGPPFK